MFYDGKGPLLSTLQQAQELKTFVEEIFAISRDFWAGDSTNGGYVDLTETEFMALDILCRNNGPMTVGDIQRQIGILPAQMSRVIRALESKQSKALIDCKINQSDKRKIDVEVTAEGEKAHQEYRSVKLGGIEKILKGLSAQDRNELVRLVRTIRVHYLTHKLRAS